MAVLNRGPLHLSRIAGLFVLATVAAAGAGPPSELPGSEHRDPGDLVSRFSALWSEEKTEAALQMLYAIDATGALLDQVMVDFWRELPGDAEGRAYADEAVRGVIADLEATDRRIQAASTNWRLERMTRVDRNLLRLGAWELVHRPDVPRAVILDEAVELAKRYGSEESGSFVNGVLDRVADDCGRQDTGDLGPSASPSNNARTG